MPQRNKTKRRLVRLALFFLATRAFLALGRERPSEPAPVRYRLPEADSVPGWASTPAPPRRPARRRLAASLAFTVLFFAGASFSAVAGDALVKAVDPEPEAAVAEETTMEETVAAEPAPAPAPEPAPVPEPAPEPELAPEPEPAPAQASDDLAVELAAKPEPAAEPEPAPALEALDAERPKAPSAPRAKVVRPQPRAELDPEVATPGTAATIWLHRALPDPTPASLRLAPELAAKLRRTAGRARLDWALVLGVVRAEGRRGIPARQSTLAEAADRLVRLGARTDAWGAALAFTGRTTAADRAVALARYYRAIGIRALVRGLRAEQQRLTARVLADQRVDVYGTGRDDLAAGRIDVRIVALIAYLAETYGQVSVSSLVTGHRVYARPGVVSAHMFGAAIDISALGGAAIAGNQQPGGLTERAVRDILLLPAEMRPRQVISLLGLGGPSFPLGDHVDHIHVGY